MNSIMQIISELLGGGGSSRMQQPRRKVGGVDPFARYFENMTNRSLWQSPEDEDPWDGVMPGFGHQRTLEENLSEIPESNFAEQVDGVPGVGRNAGIGTGAGNNYGATDTNRNLYPGQDNRNIGASSTYSLGSRRSR